MQCWLFDVLLDDVLILGTFHSSLHNHVNLNLGFGIWVLHCCVDALLYFDILVQFFLVLFIGLVQLLPQIINFWCNKDTSTLWARLRLANVEDHWVLLGLGLSNFTFTDFLLSLVRLLLRVLLYLIEVCRVHPCGREKIVVVREFFLEALQVHTKWALATNIVHAQKVVCSLRVAHTTKEIGCHATVSPENIPVVRIEICPQRPHYIIWFLLLQIALSSRFLISLLQLFELWNRTHAFGDVFLPPRQVIVRRWLWQVIVATPLILFDVSIIVIIGLPIGTIPVCSSSVGWSIKLISVVIGRILLLFFCCFLVLFFEQLFSFHGFCIEHLVAVVHDTPTKLFEGNALE